MRIGMLIWEEYKLFLSVDVRNRLILNKQEAITENEYV